jgi:uncharacterized damage-inducible protein DinB
MSVALDLQNLLSYTDHERSKWKTWLAADSAKRLAIPFQDGGRFPTVGSLLNHVFWVEERHLSRLEGHPLPETSGAPENDLNALFEYGDRVRHNLRRYVTTVEDKRFNEPITFALRGGPMTTVLRRKLAAHILLHEIRHFAQIAYAVRAAGNEPPGEHDYFFAPIDMAEGV